MYESPFGRRWVCFECDTAFFDLKKEKAICPKCSADQANNPNLIQLPNEPPKPGEPNAKDVEDIEGDRAAGIRTLPQIIGAEKSLAVALILFLLLILFTFLPIMYGWYGAWYKVVAIYVVELPLLGFLIFLWGNPSPQMLKFASRWLKAGMALGIVALVLA